MDAAAEHIVRGRDFGIKTGEVVMGRYEMTDWSDLSTNFGINVSQSRVYVYPPPKSVFIVNMQYSYSYSYSYCYSYSYSYSYSCGNTGTICNSCISNCVFPCPKVAQDKES